MSKERLIYSAITALLALTTSQTVLAAPDTSTQEKCYGIAKAGMNDCATANQSCASSATKDRQADAYLLLPKGLCQKIVGGKTK